MQIAESACAAFGQQHLLLMPLQISDQFSSGGVRNNGTYGHTQDNIIRSFAVTVGAPPVFSLFSTMHARKTIVDQSIDVAVGNGKNTAPAPAIASRRAAFGNEFFPTETCDAIAAFTRAYMDNRFVYVFHEFFNLSRYKQKSPIVTTGLLAEIK